MYGFQSDCFRRSGFSLSKSSGTCKALTSYLRQKDAVSNSLDHRSASEAAQNEKQNQFEIYNYKSCVKTQPTFIEPKIVKSLDDKRQALSNDANFSIGEV
jgi:hypothetical protein